MAVDKAMQPLDITDLIEDDEDEDELEIEVEVVDADEDGNIVDFVAELEVEVVDHDENLAEKIDEDVLRSMASELVGDFMSDRETRKDWATSYVNGMDLLGMKIEDRTEPWEGACGVFHPMLTEAVV